MIEDIKVTNPKRGKICKGHDGWYPYYAGYSSDFVENILMTSNLAYEAIILDPWNGSGTTTTVAAKLGFQVLGFDLNPVMAISAKACLVSKVDYPSLKPLATKILETTNQFSGIADPQDTLCVWFRPGSAAVFRTIELGIQNLLVEKDKRGPLANLSSIEHLSSIACFFYVALFRTINFYLADFRPSNPTWIKLPRSVWERKAPSAQKVTATFASEVLSMLTLVSSAQTINKSFDLSQIDIATSSRLPVSSNSIDLIISSPPYCTRIDYAVATMPELTLLGFDVNTSLNNLRRELIGSSTVPRDISPINSRWGMMCNNFLDAVFHHPSKASKTYYFKSHIQYFDSIFKSLLEIERVLKPNGACALVVQDSHYKDVYNNLPGIFSEMAIELGLTLVREEKFQAKRNMAKRNAEVRKYRNQISACESVLFFKKQITA